MVAAEGLVDERERGLRGVEEERIVITADETVEGCELGRGKSLDVPWRNVPVLQESVMISLYSQDKATSTDDVVCDT